jgi:predicted glycosyltransferase
MKLEELIKELEKYGYVCIPKKEYEKLKEDKEKAELELAQELAGEDW